VVEASVDEAPLGPVGQQRKALPATAQPFEDLRVGAPAMPYAQAWGVREEDRQERPKGPAPYPARLDRRAGGIALRPGGVEFGALEPEAGLKVVRTPEIARANEHGVEELTLGALLLRFEAREAAAQSLFLACRQRLG
jgi:hypothetical protein